MNTRRLNGERPTEQHVLMENAEAWAQRATCSRLSVGAVAALHGRVLATGYNGAPAGMEHCVHLVNEPCQVAVHAEANVIAWAARTGISLLGSDLLTTHEPCRACAKLIINAGVKRVYYNRSYERDSGVQLLRLAGLEVYRLHTRERLAIYDRHPVE